MEQEPDAATGRRLELRRRVDAPAVAPLLTELPTLTANSGGTWLLQPVTTSACRVDHVVEAATGAVAWTVDTDASGQQVSDVSPDRTWLALLDAKTVRIRDIATDLDRACLPGSTYRKRAVVEPYGTLLVTWLYKVVEVWDVVTARCVGTVTINRANANDVAVGPFAGRLAVACSDRRVRILDPKAGRSLRSLRASDLRCVSLAPGGKSVASGGTDGAVRLWDTETGRERAVLRGHEHAVTAVHHAPDGLRLASVDTEGEVRIWDVATTCRAVTRVPNTSVRACKWLPTGDALCLTAADGAVYVYDVID